MITLTPSNLVDAEDALHETFSQGQRLTPVGHKTRLSKVRPQCHPDVALSVGSWDQILNLDPEEQICVVQPGLSAAKLAAEITPHQLELGFQAPSEEHGTLGGAFLSAAPSLARGLWGPPHDQVLAGKWLLADGTSIQSGAGVVKSVAGYDLTRMFLGSAGRLALCTELTLRLRPQNRHARWWALPEDGAELLPSRHLLLRAFQESPQSQLYVCADASAWMPETKSWEIEPSDGNAASYSMLQAWERCAHVATTRNPSELHQHSGPIDWLGLQKGVPHPPPSSEKAQKHWEILKTCCAPDGPHFAPDLPIFTS
ncbi:MAG: FAD-binding oxidoreductase [Planctomycetes bacterium]|nr:FAD-binding oxidoreductase [Planctomycetota bacterium]